MHPQDSISVSRRALDFEDYIDVVRRHKAWIFGPAFAALVVSVVVAFLWPDTYVSTANIRVVPPQVPETYFPPNITTDMQQQIDGLTQQILSRSQLTALVNKYQLYKKELTRLPMMDVIENMKNHDIIISSVRTFNQAAQSKQIVPAFQVGFRYSDRITAQKVTEDLVASFISQSATETTVQSQGTTDLLQTQWENAKAKLEEADTKLQAFRVAHMNALPDQQVNNQAQLNALQSQLYTVGAQLSRLQNEKVQLENEVRIRKSALAQLKDPNADQQAIELRDERLASKDKEIENAENYLARLREHYTDKNPDVQQWVQQLNLLKRQREDLKKEDTSKKPADVRQLPPNPAYLREKQGIEADLTRLATLQETKDMEMKNLRKEEERINNQITSVAGRIESTPLGEKEYSELQSDKELALHNYQDADNKLTLSKKALDVTRRQEGEKLAILDPASSPQSPTEPRRTIIILVGAGIGVALGLLLAGVREVKDTSLKNLKDVRAYTQLQVLGSIPLLENDLVVRRRKRLGWLAWSTACLVGVLIMSSSVAYYFTTKV